MPVVFWREFAAVARGVKWQSVFCTNCGCRFRFPAVSEAWGKGNSLYLLDNEGAQERAAADAQRKLERVMASGVVPCPCPQCGRYQDDMSRPLGSERYAWMWAAVFPFWALYSAIAIGGGVAVALIYLDRKTYGTIGGWFCASIGVGATLFAVTATILRPILVARFDANAAVPEAERLAVGKAVAVLEDDWVRDPVTAEVHLARVAGRLPATRDG